MIDCFIAASSYPPYSRRRLLSQLIMFLFRDPVMKLWAVYYYQVLELPAVPRHQILDQLHKLGT